jgi:GntR family transcriptional regulator
VIDFRLNRHSGTPPYLQVIQQVKHAMRMGILRPGDQLPSAKSVVSQLAINVNTVLKAYRDLEREGLVEGRPGVGTFVLRVPPGPSPQTQAVLRTSLEAWLATALRAGMDTEGIEGLLRSSLETVLAEEVA